ncbi:hypothetical protein BH10BDE1_BH10BDE1_10000 [soil metagenome]
MRNISNISKRISDSVLGLALIATPLGFLAGPLSGDDAVLSTESAASTPSIAQTSSLGKFLESEITGRIERVSGRRFEAAVRNQRSREIASAVAEASYLYDVDPFLLLSMIEVESRYHADAVGLHGEIGLMQIKPSTARWIAPVTDALFNCDLHEVRCNIMMGASYVGHLQQKVEKQRRNQDELTAQNLATAPQFREHVLRSYNLGPAKANRLASDRVPAAEGDPAPYATKIAWRTDRMRSRYLVAALGGEINPPTNPAPPKQNIKSATPSISTVAMIR